MPGPAGPHCLIYFKSSDLITDGGLSRSIALFKRAKKIGWTGAHLWDNMGYRPDLRDGYPEMKEFLGELESLGMAYSVQGAYTGDTLAHAIGDMRLLESNVSDGGDPCCCLADPRVLKKWVERAPWVAKTFPDAFAFMFAYDEIRGAGTHPLCKAFDRRYGSMLAANVKAALAAHRPLLPGMRMAVWNDMFDGEVNARKGDYASVKGGWTGSWAGLDETVLVYNWATNGPKSDDEETRSWGWWPKMFPGVEQIYAGYYDYQRNSYNDGISAADEKAAIRGVIGECKAAHGDGKSRVVGYMGTSWNQQLDSFDWLDNYYPGDDIMALMEPMTLAKPLPPPPSPPKPPVPPAPPAPPAPDLRAATLSLAKADAAALTLTASLADVRAALKLPA